MEKDEEKSNDTSDYHGSIEYGSIDLRKDST